MKDNPSLSAVNGILLVNKPEGPTSNAVLQQIKRLFKAKKAGHTGSLDPLATGMLPICFGEATKFSQYLLDADKCYQTIGRLGTKTNTADAMGDVIASVDDVQISRQALLTALTQFKGPIQQIPSMYSALKHEGKALYKYARSGIEIERAPRTIHIHDIQLNHFDGRDFSLTVTCSKGTYIRNLIEDIAEHLGSLAHVVKLHRVYTAGFADEPMHTITELLELSEQQQQQCLLPIDRAVQDLPKLSLCSDDVIRLRHGKMLASQLEFGQPGLVRLYEQSMHFIGLGEILTSGGLKVKRLLA